MPKPLIFSLSFTPTVVQHLNRIGIGELCVFQMFEYHLGRVSGVNMDKIIFNLSDQVSQIEIGDVWDGIVTCQVPFDTVNYLQWNREERMSYYLAAISEVVSVLGRRFDWPMEIFGRAEDAINSAGWKFSGYIGKRKKSSSKTYVIQIYWEFFDTICVSIVAESCRDKRQCKIPLTVLPASLSGLKSTISEARWQDDDVVRVNHQNGRDYWVVNVPENKADFVYPKAVSGDAKAQYDLGVMYLQGRLVAKDFKKATEWLEKSSLQGFKRATAKLHQVEKGELDHAS